MLALHCSPRLSPTPVNKRSTADSQRSSRLTEPTACSKDEGGRLRNLVVRRFPNDTVCVGVGSTICPCDAFSEDKKNIVRNIRDRADHRLADSRYSRHRRRWP